MHTKTVWLIAGLAVTGLFSSGAYTYTQRVTNAVLAEGGGDKGGGDRGGDKGGGDRGGDKGGGDRGGDKGGGDRGGDRPNPGPSPRHI